MPRSYPTFKQAKWHNKPADDADIVELSEERVRFKTAPHTDFWQRTFYGFRVGNAPALLWRNESNLTMTVRATFEYKQRFDQAGVLLFVSDDCWAKASIELESDSLARLGSVVTNSGHSDWATISLRGDTPTSMWFRVSRRGPDFLLEWSRDGTAFEQMRICHLHALGETTNAMGAQTASELGAEPIQVGVYACSPEDSSFEAQFDNLTFCNSTWQPHE